MPRSLCFSLAAALLSLPAAAQEVEPGRWSYSSTEFRGNVAWVTGIAEDDGVWRLTVACSDGKAVLDLAPPTAPEPGATAVLTFNIGGTPIPAPVTAETPAGEAVWVGDLSEQLSRNLASGFSMVIFAPEGRVRIGLTGSARSISAVKEDCAAARDAAASAAPAPDPDAAQAALRARIDEVCAPATARAAEGAILARDLTSDTRADHVIDWSQVTCVAEDGTEAPPAELCREDICDAEIYVSPDLPPAAPTDVIPHAGLTLWPDRHVALRTQNPDYTKPFDWRWDGSEFLASIPQP